MKDYQLICAQLLNLSSWYHEIKHSFKKTMNLDEIPESETESSSEEEEDIPKAPPKQSVVKKWMMVLPKKEAAPKTEIKKLCETLLMKNL